MPRSILDLIIERKTDVAAAIAILREQIGKLTDELRTAETELNDLATTGTTVTRLTSTSDLPASDGPLDDTAHQQIIAVFQTGDGGAMSTKDICHALGLGTGPKDTEGIRAKLKCLVKRRILSEAEPGLFALATPTAKRSGEHEVGVHSAQSVEAPRVDAVQVDLVVDANGEVAKRACEPGVLEVRQVESLRAVGAQKAHGVGPAQAGEHVVLARRQHRVTPVEQCHDATVAVEENVVREQVVVTHDVGNVDRACPFDHRFEPVNVGHDLVAAVGDPWVVAPIAQHLDAPFVHVGAGQEEAGDFVHGTHRPSDRVGVVPGCLATVDEGEQRIAAAKVRGGVRAVESSLRRRNGDAPGSQLCGQRQCGVAVGLLTPQFHEPVPVGERVRFEPARMRPQLADLDTEGIADLSRRRRPYYAPHHQDATVPEQRVSDPLVSAFPLSGLTLRTGDQRWRSHRVSPLISGSWRHRAGG
ncbi:MAG TPA: hypothetical protein VGD29_29110 [Actinoplanes sp.]